MKLILFACLLSAGGDADNWPDVLYTVPFPRAVELWEQREAAFKAASRARFPGTRGFPGYSRHMQVANPRDHSHSAAELLRKWRITPEQIRRLEQRGLKWSQLGVSAYQREEILRRGGNPDRRYYAGRELMRFLSRPKLARNNAR